MHPSIPLNVSRCCTWEVGSTFAALIYLLCLLLWFLMAWLWQTCVTIANCHVKPIDHATKGSIGVITCFWLERRNDKVKENESGHKKQVATGGIETHVFALRVWCSYSLSYRGAIFPSTFLGIICVLNPALTVLASARTHGGGYRTSFLSQVSHNRWTWEKATGECATWRHKSCQSQDPHYVMNNNVRFHFPLSFPYFKWEQVIYPMLSMVSLSVGFI